LLLSLVACGVGRAVGWGEL